MRGTQHLLYGTATTLAFYLGFREPGNFDFVDLTNSLIFIGGGVVGSVLPDIDTKPSIVSNIFPLCHALLAKIGIKHRKYTHDLGLFICMMFLFLPIYPQILGLSIGCLSHLLLDGLTKEGIAFSGLLIKNHYICYHAYLDVKRCQKQLITLHG